MEDEMDISIRDTQDNPLFPKFGVLPPEIRLKIWEEVCSIPRIIDLWGILLGSSHGEEFFLSQNRPTPFAYRSHNGVPPILFVCKEARKVALSKYSLSFGNYQKVRKGAFTMEISSFPSIYVNWEFDIICPIPIMTDPADPPCDPSPFFEDILMNRTQIRRMAWQFNHLIRMVKEGHFIVTHPELEEIIIYQELEEINKPYKAHRPIRLKFVSSGDGGNWMSAKALADLEVELEKVAEGARKGLEFAMPVMRQRFAALGRVLNDKSPHVTPKIIKIEYM